MTVDDRLRSAHARIPDPDAATIARARARLLEELGGGEARAMQERCAERAFPASPDSITPVRASARRARPGRRRGRRHHPSGHRAARRDERRRALPAQHAARRRDVRRAGRPADHGRSGRAVPDHEHGARGAVARARRVGAPRPRRGEPAPPGDRRGRARMARGRLSRPGGAGALLARPRPGPTSGLASCPRSSSAAGAWTRSQRSPPTRSSCATCSCAPPADRIRAARREGTAAGSGRPS